MAKKTGTRLTVTEEREKFLKEKFKGLDLKIKAYKKSGNDYYYMVIYKGATCFYNPVDKDTLTEFFYTKNFRLSYVRKPQIFERYLRK